MVNAQTVLRGKYRLLVLAGVFVGVLAQRGTALAQCGGDCDENGLVDVSEIILGVNISFDTAPLSSCPAMDTDSSSAVEIHELVGAVNRALVGCPHPTCLPPPGGRCVEINPGAGAQDDLLGALIEAQPNDVIFIKEGTYDLTEQLSLTVPDVTVQGEGTGRTILRFPGLTGAGEAMLVRAGNFTLRDIALEDAGGADLFKAEGIDGVHLQHVRAEWTNGPDTSNGGYGLYPVQCRNVLIEDSIVKGAADAGLYIGQSRNIIVRRNHVELNVAGIEIENSTDAEVYDNVSAHNSGGVLVFNLPGPQVQGGRRTHVHDNQIFENNTPNFAAEGSSVSYVPTGTGSIILANDEVEISNNTFRDNDSSHVILISYNTAVLFGQEPPNNPDFDPYSETIFVHDNTFEGGGEHPPAALDPVVEMNGGLPLPSIILDGDLDKAKLVDDQLPDALRVCVQQPDATFLDLDIAHGFAGKTHDLSVVDCTHDSLPQIHIGDGRHVEITPGPDAQDQLLTALIEAQPGDDILVKAGTYELTEQLSLTVDHVTLRGEGMDQTILRFDGLTGGGEAVLARADDFTLRDIAIQDGGQADLFKAEGVDGLRVQRVRAEWTNGANQSNGGYGIYPVQCKDVLIEESFAKGASDTGIYVGQSRNVIVRRNHAEFNVAGIEIENSTGVDVYENTSTNNAGGILVFNLPALQVFGQRTRVFNNQSFENNTPNFAPPGNIVGGVPTGTGMFVLANDMVEVFGNTFRDNDTAQISLISYNTARVLDSSIPAPTDPNFDPWSESIYVHDNTYDGGGTMPPSSLNSLLGLLQDACGLPGGLPVPQVVVDGDFNPAKLVDGMLPDALRTCVQDPTATFVNLDFAHGFAGAACNPAPYNCTLPHLNPIAIAGVQ